MSPTVPRPPPLSLWFVFGAVGTWTVVVSGGAWGSGANGLLCASATGGAARTRIASARTTRTSMPVSLAIEQAFEPQGVAGGEALPVVVEVAEDLAAGGDLAQARRPLLQLAPGVVAAAPARAVVEAHEGEVRRGRRLGERPARVVGQDGRDAVLAQERVDLGRKPALVAELEGVAAGRQLGQRAREALVVAPELRRQLPEQRAEAAAL